AEDLRARSLRHDGRARAPRGRPARRQHRVSADQADEARTSPVRAPDRQLIAIVPRTIQVAEPRGEELRIGIIVARFNQAVTDALLAGALEALHQHGASDDAIDVVVVPGAFEL